MEDLDTASSPLPYPFPVGEYRRHRRLSKRTANSLGLILLASLAFRGEAGAACFGCCCCCDDNVVVVVYLAGPRPSFRPGPGHFSVFGFVGLRLQLGVFFPKLWGCANMRRAPKTLIQEGGNATSSLTLSGTT